MTDPKFAKYLRREDAKRQSMERPSEKQRRAEYMVTQRANCPNCGRRKGQPCVGGVTTCSARIEHGFQIGLLRPEDYR